MVWNRTCVSGVCLDFPELPSLSVIPEAILVCGKPCHRSPSSFFCKKSGASLVVASKGYSLFVLWGLLIAVASSCYEATTLGLMGFRSLGPQALEHKLSSWGTRA